MYTVFSLSDMYFSLPFLLAAGSMSQRVKRNYAGIQAGRLRNSH